MSTGTLLLEVHRAQAEAARRALNDWQPPEDVDQRVRQVEESVREMIELPGKLKQVVRSAFDNMPQHGSLLSYINHQRSELTACFRSALESARKLRDIAWSSEKAGRSVPSLPLLERAIREIERIESDTLDHWVEFDPNQKIGPTDDYISNEDVFRDIEAHLSEESRRELQNRLERLGRQGS